MPSFTKGRKQITRYEVDWSRGVRLLIGQVKKKFSVVSPIIILKKQINGIYNVDRILTVCAALFTIVCLRYFVSINKIKLYTKCNTCRDANRLHAAVCF